MLTVGSAPEEMGIGPALAIPSLLDRHGLSLDDIDLLEINEAFAAQLVYCRDRLGLDPEKLNVNGGAISIGYPYGMSGSRLVGHALLVGRRRGARLTKPPNNFTELHNRSSPTMIPSSQSLGGQS
ncbi:MAG: hypothetical protein E5Y79_09975 [Mesorhizobium sp.]|uniref:hypothetical protein n=1 Tax=Mesorhizobium sp. TaxID=1871066 RepID=UPI0012104417|nr:hypothetical protein [Mesorhizobium sp.]TIL60581.1 MAG: hypothetical protein E5Y79_09975 [Mesorhizobium sp.]